MQKVIAAREFTSDSKVIIADQPTRGIDVGSTEFIRGQLVEIARKKRKQVSCWYLQILQNCWK